MSLQFVFGTPIWHFTDSDPEICKQAYDWALSVRKAVPGVIRSNRGGYQSDDSNNFNELPFTEHIMRRLYPLPNFNLMNWWLNVNEPGNYNLGHVHPNCDLSVVWYITDNHGTLTVDNPFAFNRYRLIKGMDEEFMLRFDCKAGDIIVFPSDLYHHVQENETDETRISVAINLEL